MPRDPRKPPKKDTKHRTSLVEQFEHEIRAAYKMAVAEGCEEPMVVIGEPGHPMSDAMAHLARAEAPPELDYWLFGLSTALMLPFWRDQSPHTVGRIPLATHFPVMVFVRDGTLIAALSIEE